MKLNQETRDILRKEILIIDNKLKTEKHILKTLENSIRSVERNIKEAENRIVELENKKLKVTDDLKPEPNA